MNKKLLGVLTIGQSPRPDMTPEFAALMGDAFDIIEAGALDGLERAEIEAMKPHEEDTLLVTRMSDGAFVTVAEELIYSNLELQAKKLFERGAQAVILLCTGPIPSLNIDGAMIYPDSILVSTLKALAKGRRLGVLCPEEGQFEWMRARWQAVSEDIFIEAAMPFDPTDSLVKSAQKLENTGAEFIIMDCMGYTLQMQAELRQAVKIPVILAKRLVASLVREVWG
jgi:protein AroM